MADTIYDLYAATRKLFKAAGISMPDLEARELVAAATGADKSRTADWGHRYIDEPTRARAEDLCRRRLDGEPLAYLLGEWDFYGLTFQVTPDVLIPRPDTERLCELAIGRAAQVVNPRVLDLCAGSGCIGLSLAHEVEDARVVLLDVSDAALSVERENARRLGVDRRAIVMKGDALQAPVPALGRFHILTCNPPYVTGDEMAALDRSVAAFEPHLALYGGADGLDFYRAIAKNGWLDLLLPGGQAYFECGDRQYPAVAAILEDTNRGRVHVEEDTFGVQRIVVLELWDE